MSDELQTAATIASLLAEVERLKAYEIDARTLYLKYRDAFGLLVTSTNARFDSINDALEATGIVLGDDDDYEDCIQRLAKERDESNADSKRLLAENVQLRERYDSLSQSIINACTGTKWLNAHELRQALDRERERVGVLEAEVRAWRAAFDEETGKQVGDSSDCRDVASCRAETDTRHALDAAKFGKEQA